MLDICVRTRRRKEAMRWHCWLTTTLYWRKEQVHITRLLMQHCTRMLGIYLDNAIEASMETEHPIVNFHLGKMNQDIVFIISNTFIDRGLSVAQMYKKEITTKGRGHGIGLSNVSEILNRYDNIYYETLIDGGMFIQQIRIS